MAMIGECWTIPDTPLVGHIQRRSRRDRSPDRRIVSLSIRLVFCMVLSACSICTSTSNLHLPPPSSPSSTSIISLCLDSLSISHRLSYLSIYLYKIANPPYHKTMKLTCVVAAQSVHHHTHLIFITTSPLGIKPLTSFFPPYNLHETR